MTDGPTIGFAERAMWFALGGLATAVFAAAVLWPTMRLAFVRVERRARDAERRARGAEQLAELGSMTSGLAHEIKNPLSTVGLNAQLLAEEIEEAELPPERRQRLLRRVGTLGREAERLRNILTDFLRFAGRMRLDPQTHDLRRLVEELCDFVHPQCEQAGVLLRPDLGHRPVPMPLDEGLVKQALLNLMLNALQAMDGGRGELIVRLEPDADEVRVHVIDTGPGIEPDRLEAIFRPYVSGRGGGTGLGLPTARRIAEEHGGRLVAHSKPGSGSDFVLHLPRRAAPASVEPAAGSESAASGT